MAAITTWIPGPCDTDAFAAAVTRAPTLFTKAPTFFTELAFRKNTLIGLLSDPVEHLQVASAFGYLRYLHLTATANSPFVPPSNVQLMVYTIGECLVPESTAHLHPEAADVIVNDVFAWVAGLIDHDAFWLAISDVFSIVPTGAAAVTQANFTVAAINTLVAARVVRTDCLEAYVTFLVAACKRGSVSENIIRKISDDVRSMVDTTHDFSLSSDIIFDVYRYFMRDRDLTPAGMRSAVARWSTYATLMIMQVPGGGITVQVIIGNTLKAHPSFPWAQFFSTPDVGVEADALMGAVAAVGDEDFYGFQKGLGPASPTKYVGIGWCCQFISSELDKNQILSKYGGLKRAPRYESEFRKFYEPYTTWFHDRSFDPLPHYPVVVVSPATTALLGNLYAALHANVRLYK